MHKIEIIFAYNLAFMYSVVEFYGAFEEQLILWSISFPSVLNLIPPPPLHFVYTLTILLVTLLSTHVS